SASRVVLNLSISSDVNMRVFEALACGSLLVTDDLAGHGLERLFTAGQHLVVYEDFEELLEKVNYYLEHEDERERIAATGMREVVANHTYSLRMDVLLDHIKHHQQQPPRCQSRAAL